MTTRSKSQAEGIGLKAVYAIGELARLAHVSRHLMWKLLEARNVTCLRAGRLRYIPLSEIQDKIPGLYRSLCAAEEGKAAARRAFRP